MNRKKLYFLGIALLGFLNIYGDNINLTVMNPTDSKFQYYIKNPDGSVDGKYQNAINVFNAFDTKEFTLKQIGVNYQSFVLTSITSQLAGFEGEYQRFYTYTPSGKTKNPGFVVYKPGSQLPKEGETVIKFSK